MSKKILFVSNRLIGGGSERVLVTLANTFSNKGYETYIISYQDGDRYYINPKVVVKTLHNEKSKAKRINMLHHQIKSISPDIVISFEYFVNMQTIIACIGLRVKLIVSERNDPARRGGGFLKGKIRNFLYRFCDILVCQTPDAKSYFPSYIQKHTVIIPNPIKENLPEVWYGEREQVIVNFCRLQKQKNLSLLIDAFEDFKKDFSSYKLIIYGDGEEKDKLQSYIESKHLEGEVILHNSVLDVHERIVKATMFVSSSDYEGLSNSMIEAMAIGLPTICTDCPVGGARMVIENNVNGILVPPGNSLELKKAMSKLACNNELREKLIANGIRIKEELSVENIYLKWKEILSE